MHTLDKTSRNYFSLAFCQDLVNINHSLSSRKYLDYNLNVPKNEKTKKQNLSVKVQFSTVAV